MAFRNLPALVALILALLSWAGAVRAGAPVVVANESKAYHQQAIVALRRASAIPIEVLHLPLANAPPNSRRVLVALGPEALAQVARAQPKRRYVGALVSLRTYRRLFADTSLHPPRATLLIDQPLERQLALTRKLLPSLERIGVLINAENPLELPATPGLELIVRRVPEDVDPVMEIKPLLRDVDALLAAPDPVTFNRKTIHALFLSAYRHRKPVLGYSYPLVKAGALFSAYATPEMIGAQLAPLIERVARDEFSAPVTLHSEQFRIAVNHGIARILGVSETFAGLEDRVFESVEQLP